MASRRVEEEVEEDAAASCSISFFLSQLDNHRFDEPTIRLLESILVTKDVASLLDIRSKLQDLLRSRSVSLLREMFGRSVDEKLRVAQFFSYAFALAGDAHSCLALKYEALLLRGLKSANDPLLQVSFKEWLTFANDSFDHGFYSIAIKGFDNALFLVNSSHRGGIEVDFSSEDRDIVNKIKQCKNMALSFVDSCSVQMQTAKYLNEKRNLQECDSHTGNTPQSASSLFREAIKTRNLHKLLQSRIMR